MSPPSDRDPVERLAEEFLERHRRGEQPDVEEYTANYPQWADAIRDLFPALLMMEQLRPVSENLTAAHTPAGNLQEAAAVSPKLERLGDYRILREVGRGGMGIVYEAVQESLGRHVALKTLPSSALLDDRQRQRFAREARASARLHHTNIVPVFGVGEHDGLQYYVMQFIQGQSLDQVLAELQRFGKAPTSPAGRTAGPAGSDRGQVHTVGTGGVTGTTSAAGIAAQLLSGQFAMTQATAADGPEAAGLLGTQDFTPGGRARDTQGPDIAVPPTLGSGSGTGSGSQSPSRVESSSVAGLLTGSGSGATSSHGHSSTFRHYATSVTRIGVQACEALDYAHGQGIVHRDVKPSNLLLDLQGSVWITDFGLAKAADEENLTHTGDLLGTLRYMAPERFQGRSDARSDIYALGLTLYEMLARRSAFEGTDRNSLIRKVTTETPPALRKIDPRVPRDLETIVAKAIDREPAQRYQTAGEMAEDLRRFLQDKPIHARRISLPEQVWRWSHRNPALAGMAAALLLILAVVAVGSSVAALRFKNLARNEGLARSAAELSSQRAEQRRREAVLSRQQAESARKQEAAERKRAEQATAESQSNLVEAQRQRQRAEASFQQARAAVDDSLTRISENKLLNVPGLRPLRKELIEAALKYYQGFVQQRGDEPELQHDLAAAYTRVGRITADVGSKRSALSAYRQAIAIQAELVRRAAEAQRPAALAELARSHQAVGRLAVELGQRPEAQTAFGEAETLWRKAANQEPGNPELQSGLADCLNDTGALAESDGQLERAIQQYRDALLIQRKLVGDHAKHPQIARFRHVLARQYLRMGHLQLALKVTPEHFVHVLGNAFPLAPDPLFFEKQAQEALRGLVRDFPSHENLSEFRRDLAEATESIAAFQAEKDQAEDALRSYQEALGIREQLARENPTVPDLQAELARAYSTIGKVHFRRQDWPLALPQIRSAVERQRLVVMLSPREEGPGAVLGRLLGDLGRTEGHLGQTDEALRDLGEARDLLGRLSRPAPQDLYDLAALGAAGSALVGKEPGKSETELAAVAAFEKAVAAGFVDLERARNDPDLDPLRSRADFKALLERLARVQQGIVWVLDMEEAKAQAARENKDLFIYFSGSDWCPWCVLFHRDVLSKPAFIEEVPRSFVMVQLDSPMTKPKPPNFATIADLKQRWQVLGVPMVVLADSQGKPFARVLNIPTPEARASYVANLQAARKVRASRDEALARAKTAKGLERAKHLDAALRVLPPELIPMAYGDLSAEIVALDAKNEAGLRTTYQRSGVSQVRNEVQAANKKRDWTGVIHLLNDLEVLPQPAGSPPVELVLNDYYLRGSAHAELGHFEEAEADFARTRELLALQKPPMATQYYLSRHAPLLLATGRLDDYRRTCEGLLELAEAAPDPVTARFVLSALSLSPAAVADQARMLRLAEKHFGGGGGGAATGFPSLRMLGTTYCRAGRFAEAIERLNQAIKFYDADPKAPPGAADTLFATDGLFLALAYHGLGDAEQAQRTLDQARERWERSRKVFEKDPTRAFNNNWYYRLPTALVRAEAEALIEGAPGTDDDDPLAVIAAARARIRLGQWDAARSELDRALELIPGDLRLKLERGRCQAQLGRDAEAAADFAEVIAVKLREVESRRTAHEGKPPAQRRESLKLLSAAYHDLAATQREAGLRDEAAATYREIQALWPGQAEPLFRVARGLAACVAHATATATVRKEGQSPDSSLEEEAMDVLKQAALAGFTDSQHVQVAMGFEPLRSRPDFRKLVPQLARSALLPLTAGELRRYVGHQHVSVEAVAVSSDGRRALSVGDDRTARLWDVDSGRELRRFDGHTAPVYDAAFTPDGQRAVTCSVDGTLRVWDLATGRQLQRITVGTGRDYKLALSPDGRQALAGGTDGTLALWDLTTGQQVRPFPESLRSDPARTVAFAPDGHRALSAGTRGVVSLWDVEEGRLIRRLEGHRGAVWCATFTPDGRRALTGGADGRLILWDLESGRPLRELAGHANMVRAVAVLPDGRRAVSGGQAGLLSVWDLESGNELYRLLGSAGVLGLAPLADGRRALTAENDGLVRLRDLSEDSARFRDLARLGQWEQALALNPSPRDPRLRLALAWYRAQNQQWDLANADPSLAAPQAEGLGVRQVPLLDPRLEEQLRPERVPAGRVVIINLTRRGFNGDLIESEGRRRRVFTLAVGEGFALGTLAKNCFLLGSSRVDLQACKLEYSIVSPK